MSHNLFRILTHKSKMLRTPATEEILFPMADRIENLIDKTIDTLRYNDGVYAKRGLAISANQIGSLKRFFVYSDPGVMPLCKKINIVCNPEVVDVSSELEEMEEGCLSIPKWHCLVSRPKQCVIKYQDFSGNHQKIELDGFIARVFQHEIDHLNGVTILDKQIKIVDNPLYKEFLQKKKQERLLKKKENKTEIVKEERIPEDF